MTPVESLRAYTAAAIRLWNRLDDEAWQTFRDGGPLDEQEAWAAGLEALHALDELLEVTA